MSAINRKRLVRTKGPLIENWKTLKLGMFERPEEIGEIIRKKGMVVGQIAEDLLSSGFRLCSPEIEVALVFLSVRDLGFEMAELKDIFERAQELGLRRCPPELGFQLRWQYLDQPKGEYCMIAMDPIRASDGNPYIICVDNISYSPTIDADLGCFDSLWVSNDRFVWLPPLD